MKINLPFYLSCFEDSLAWREESEKGWQGKDPVELLFLSPLLERLVHLPCKDYAFGEVFLLMLKKEVACLYSYYMETTPKGESILLVESYGSLK